MCQKVFISVEWEKHVLRSSGPMEIYIGLWEQRATVHTSTRTFHQVQRKSRKQSRSSLKQSLAAIRGLYSKSAALNVEAWYQIRARNRKPYKLADAQQPERRSSPTHLTPRNYTVLNKNLKLRILYLLAFITQLHLNQSHSIFVHIQNV